MWLICNSDFPENVAQIGVLSYKVGRFFPRMLLKTAKSTTKCGNVARAD
ncbi:hypothetical protein HMPREF1573_00833 [Gardnerella vaginalis JCP7276]|nr:hypothetical protein HMPREF1573_00833 [Gardnerella vaginalis JCP7276]